MNNSSTTAAARKPDVESDLDASLVLTVRAGRATARISASDVIVARELVSVALEIEHIFLAALKAARRT